MTLREAAQQALEALEDVPYMSNKDDYERLERVKTALRQALEKPEYRRGDRLLCLETEEYCVIHISGTDRQYVKFPDGHVGQYTNQQVADHFELLPKEVDADDTSEKRVDETAKQEHEPVAFINVEKQKLEWAKLTSWHTPTIVNLPKIPLYTAPPKQWVGLTDEEVSEIIDREIGFNSCWGPEEKFARAIEQALKEKNT
jgi:hypothetical protein